MYPEPIALTAPEHPGKWHAGQPGQHGPDPNDLTDPELETSNMGQQGPLQHTGQPGQLGNSQMGTVSQIGPTAAC